MPINLEITIGYQQSRSSINANVDELVALRCQFHLWKRTHLSTSKPAP